MGFFHTEPWKYRAILNWIHSTSPWDSTEFEEAEMEELWEFANQYGTDQGVSRDHKPQLNPQSVGKPCGLNIINLRVKKNWRKI